MVVGGYLCYIINTIDWTRNLSITSIMMDNVNGVDFNRAPCHHVIIYMSRVNRLNVLLKTVMIGFAVDGPALSYGINIE